MNCIIRIQIPALFVTICLYTSSTQAGIPTLPFTEDFPADSAAWRDSAGTAALAWNAAGGIDNGAYSSGNFNFLASATNSTPAIIRAHDAYDSSADAFVGNWIGSGVDRFSFHVRHDAPTPLTFFARIAGSGNFPAVAAVHFVPVQPNVWTPVNIPIVLGNPQFVFEGGPSNFNSVFGAVGNIQIGVSVPAALAGQDQAFTFDIDRVSLVPEPVSLALLLTGLALARRRRIAINTSRPCDPIQLATGKVSCSTAALGRNLRIKLNHYPQLAARREG